jgi:tetratricopeptide (TPR) repeat protein
VDERHLEQAEAAYAAGNWQHAALEFMASVHGDPSDGAGHALHYAGNALVKLGRYGDAATVYRKATEDTGYEKRSSVFANLGAALSADSLHEQALEAYDTALDAGDYPTPYKALQGRASALYGLGRFEDAAQAYRQAAWSEGNPDPGKALNNLGQSFMALSRPEEAIEAFKAALGIEGYAAKGKATANLGLAYAAIGFFEEAAREFERARDELDYPLTGSVLETYEAAVKRARFESTGPIGEPIEDVERETIDGWVTGEIPGTGSRPVESTGPIELIPGPDDEATQRFFTITEGEMKDADREARKAERVAKRTPKVIIMRVLIAVAVVAVVGGGLAGAFLAGYGFPTQEQTVTSLLDSYRANTNYAEFWVAVPTADVKQEMRALPAKFTSYMVSGVNRAATKSMVRVVVKLESGSTLSYDVQLAREGVGWKVVGLQNTFGSTGS